MECEHEFTAKVVPAELFENGETAQFVIIRGAATTITTTTTRRRRSSRGANCPDRLKRGHEAKQEVRSRLRVVYSAKNSKQLQLHGNDNAN
jgi:hypothetical protein